MENIILIAIACSAILSPIIIFFYFKKNLKNDLALNLIKQDIDSMKKRFEQGYSQMAHQLGRIQEIGHSMKDFQDFLKTPKLRGNLGEQILRDLLEQVLPKGTFKIQHQFKEGQIVDAIIKIKQGIIPIDSKFPIESYRKAESSGTRKEFVRSIKKHVDDISRKYILPQEGTIDFALMYVPSEPVYYEITLNQPEILEYGYSKKVYFVSPNSFYYFLKIVLVALEGTKIEEASRAILQGLKAVQQESIKFGEDLSVLTTHIEHAKSSSDKVQIRFGALTGKMNQLSSLEAPKKNDSRD